MLLREDYMQALRILLAEEITTTETMICVVGETEGVLTSSRQDSTSDVCCEW